MLFTFSKLGSGGNLQAMWAPDVTGDYIKDCQKGRDYAD